MASDSAFAASPTAPDVQSLLEGRITFEAPPAWADTLDFDRDAPRQNGDAVTCLLHHEQLHAEEGRTFSRIVLRLESLQAVQELAQWRLDLNVRTQRLALHALRIRREHEVADFADPGKVRIVARAEGLGAFVPQEHYTLLTLLEDVRPGDCLEVAYTLSHRPLLLAEHCHRLLFLPGNHAIDRYEWSVLHRPARGLRYLSSSAVGAPEVGEASRREDDGLVRWKWRGSLRERAPAEEQTPPWQFPDQWLQLSDLPDWGAVARAVDAAWPPDPGHDDLAAEVRRITAQGTTVTKRVELAIRLVQDQFRFLSLSLDLGGQAAAAPREVLRRRYGDSKDLSLLLCHLLASLGVTARPVLVHSKLGPRLPELLPSPALFNHVVVEFTIGGETRWVDATVRAQGGGPLGRALAPFGFGLTVGPTASALRIPPAATPQLDEIQEIHETVLLDTRGSSSMLRFRQRLTGRHADAFRSEIEMAGAKEHLIARTAFFAARYGDAENESPLIYEDDRELNALRTLEVYRVRGFVDLTRGGGRCTATLPPSFALLALPGPGTEERRSPWFLTHPLKIEHTMEVVAKSLPALRHLSHTFAGDAITLLFRRKFARGRWLQTLSLRTHLSLLPAESIKRHAQILEAANTQCAWGIETNASLARQHRGHNFNEMLPSHSRPISSKRISASPLPTVATPVTSPIPPTAPFPAAGPADRPASIKQRSVLVRAGKRRHPFSPWLWLVVGFVIAGAATVYYVMFHENQATPIVRERNELP